MKVEYESHSSVERRDFERTFINLLHLQNLCGTIHIRIITGQALIFYSGQRMHVSEGPGVEDFASKPGLYPLQVLVQPIAARFKFHFEGTRPTNRLDKVIFSVTWFIPELSILVVYDTAGMVFYPHFEHCARAQALPPDSRPAAYFVKCIPWSQRCSPFPFLMPLRMSC